MTIENLIEYFLTALFFIIVLFIAIFLFAMFLGWGYYCLDNFFFSQLNF